jgi:hypothetical protein
MKLITDRTPKAPAKHAALRLMRLDDRINPADYHWTGASDDVFTNPANWENNHYPDQAGDVAIFDSKTGAHAPVLTGLGTTLPDMRVTDGCDYGITINASLHVEASDFTGTGGSITGTGNLYLNSGAGSMPATANHSWDGTPGQGEVRPGEGKQLSFHQLHRPTRAGRDGRCRQWPGHRWTR